jgi:UDP:flavonoid glycosyltransferase YjiC (YdhE family)
MTPTSKFLIVTWDGGGNTPSAFNLGSRLARRGHRVRMLGWESMAKRAADAGIEFVAYPSERPLPAGLSHDEGWLDYVEPMLFGEAARRDILAEAAAFGPDVLVLDCMLGAAFAAARELRLPAAVLVHVLYSPFVNAWGDEMMHRSVAGLFAEADRVLAMVPPGFDTPSELPANTSYVGPITRPDPGRLEPSELDLLTRPGDPWVLLSLSTTLQGQTDALPSMLGAVGGMPVRVLLTLGGVVPIDAVAAPPNVVVRDYVPHDLVLPYMSAVITHAGVSTITAALAAGVPLLCIPQGREQPLNAARVAASGAGRVVEPKAPAAEIAAAIASTLRDEAARESARHFAATIAELGAGERATDLVEQLSQPVVQNRPVSQRRKGFGPDGSS